ncbi:MAG: DUF3833 domain-containing protein [Alphaproteobacteria bacterium]|jgi:hypothetical protein
MKKIYLLMLGAVMALSGCSGKDGTQYETWKPTFNLREYFTGPIKAWGIVQDRSGNVVSRFDIKIVGSWKGKEGKLVEDFTYYDGKTQQRIWHITDLGNGKYEGRAADIIGTADSTTFGNAAQWTYTMDLPVGDSTYRLRFDDWMWLMNDGVLMNRSYMKKFGFTVAEVTIFMQKQPQ